MLCQDAVHQSTVHPMHRHPPQFQKYRCANQARKSPSNYRMLRIENTGGSILLPMPPEPLHRGSLHRLLGKAWSHPTIGRCPQCTWKGSYPNLLFCRQWWGSCWAETGRFYIHGLPAPKCQARERQLLIQKEKLFYTCWQIKSCRLSGLAGLPDDEPIALQQQFRSSNDARFMIPIFFSTSFPAPEQCKYSWTCRLRKAWRIVSVF